MTSLTQRILDDLIAADQRLNAFVGGDIDQTLSCAAYARHLAGDDFWMVVIDRLFSPGHCRGVWETYMEGLAAGKVPAGAQQL